MNELSELFGRIRDLPPGRRLKLARDLWGWSQETAAAKVFVSQATWSLWERGRTPTREQQDLIAAVTNISRSLLFGDDEAVAA